MHHHLGDTAPKSLGLLNDTLITPFLNRNQADDFFGVMAIGTAALWALGGVAGGLAAAVVAGCGIGLWANHKDDVVRPTPINIDEHYEQELLRRGFGMRTVKRYRFHRSAGLQPRTACREAVFEALQRRRPRA